MRSDRAGVALASTQFSQLQRDLNRMSVRQRRQMQAQIARVGQAALSDARSRAGMWSSRIPNAISGRPRASSATGVVGYTLYVNVRKAAPHGRAFEGITRDGPSEFDHPVFGSATRWATQKTRPFLWPAVRGRAPEMLRGIEKAIEDAAREAGFR